MNYRVGPKLVREFILHFAANGGQFRSEFARHIDGPPHTSNACVKRDVEIPSEPSPLLARVLVMCAC